MTAAAAQHRRGLDRLRRRYVYDLGQTIVNGWVNGWVNGCGTDVERMGQRIKRMWNGWVNGCTTDKTDKTDGNGSTDGGGRDLFIRVDRLPKSVNGRRTARPFGVAFHIGIAENCEAKYER